MTEVSSIALPQRPVRRVALGVEYDGSQYHGWQIQRKPPVPTVQAELEQALEKIANHPVSVVCAGRTDAGVHGTCQVVHFETTVDRPYKAWIRGTNTQMDPSVRVVWAKDVADDFHARFSATARRYRYVIANTAVQPGIFHKGLTWHAFPLDAERMHRAAQYLVGEQDFTSFRALACQSNTPFREVKKVQVSRRGDLVIVDIQANAFLLHMVRNIVGSLLFVGDGRREPEWIESLMALKDRSQAAATAAPNGLYLVAVDYPAAYEIPEHPLGPCFFVD
ncbi:tRNA pseudouridine38-40 synthase [Sinobacterium caligoides]|uniref:tRNA pseudouridine synthase A n=1 Tax=Sinobacterium caligoides TaxID=933926 RepID=A0A3N2DJV3_9GAMM|nr:tRNA pseudouridine(38-40) synthase TruA [Sinobacterium caligoides]ROR99968.1 tRNA pseudouridine38-40 synthase [Sinobacterium caligoides]